MRVAPISFQKTLVKNCVIPDKRNYSSDCAIYKLDLPEDVDYFSKAQRDKKWNNNRFLDEIEESLQFAIKEENNYVIENDKGDCLGYISTSDDNENKIKEVLFLETCPHYASANPKRGLKYIGETLLSYVVDVADKNGFECVSVPIVSSKAEDFYTKKCGFEQDLEDASGEVLLPKKDFHKLIKQNQEHTEVGVKQKKFFSVFKTKKGE